MEVDGGGNNNNLDSSGGGVGDEYTSEDEDKENLDPQIHYEISGNLANLKKQLHSRVIAGQGAFEHLPLDFESCGAFEISAAAKKTMVKDLKKTAILGISPAVKSVPPAENDFLNVEGLMAKNPRLNTSNGVLSLLEFIFATAGIKQMYDPPRLVSSLSLGDDYEIDLTKFITSILQKLNGWTYALVKADLHFDTDLNEVSFKDSKLYKHLVFYELLCAGLVEDVRLATRFIPECVDDSSDEELSSDEEGEKRKKSALREEAYLQNLMECVAANKTKDHNTELEIQTAKEELTYERVYSLKSRQANCNLAALLTFKRSLALFQKRQIYCLKKINAFTQKEEQIMDGADFLAKERLVRMRNNLLDQMNASYLAQLKEKFSNYFLKYCNLSMTLGAPSYAQRLNFTQKHSSYISQDLMNIKQKMLQQILNGAKMQGHTIFEVEEKKW